MPEFRYSDPFPLAAADTRYRLLTKEHVSTTSFDGQEILKVAPEALTELAREAFREISFFYREQHLKQVAAILDDPEASDNDRGVALALLRNHLQPNGNHAGNHRRGSLLGPTRREGWWGWVSDSTRAQPLHAE